MATLKASIRIYDGMSPALQSMNRVMNVVINNLQALEATSARSVDVSALHSAREELARSTVLWDKLEQDIKGAGIAQQNFNNDIRNGRQAADGLANKIKNYALAFGGVNALKKTLTISDDLVASRTSMDIFVDDGGSVKALEDKIYALSINTGSYFLDNMQVISKLGVLAGEAFYNNDQMLRYTELMNKSFATGRASATEQASAKYQLTQALASGRLQGDEYVSIIENAPKLARGIEGYMQNIIGATGTMKDWASQGLLTSQVVINSMFYAADEIEERFNKMPLTWGRIWNNMKSYSLKVFDPIFTRLSEIANSENFQKLMTVINGALFTVGQVLSKVFEWVVNIGAFFVDNWGWIGPLVLGIAGAFLAYEAAIIAVNVAQGIAKGVTAALTIAQQGLNLAMMANPVGLIVAAVFILIGAFYAIINAINKVKGTSISATGVIVGSFLTAFAAIGNTVIGVINGIIQYFWTIFVEPFIGIIEWVLNVANGGFDSFGDAVKNLLGQICSWFLSLGKVVTKIIDAIFGTSWTAGLESLQENVLAWGKNDSAITLERKSPTINYRFDYSDTYSKGYSAGEKLENKIGGIFKFDSMNSLYSNTEGINDNTDRMANSMEMAESDLKFLRDIAERETINKITTAEIKLEMHSAATIHDGVDLDGYMNRLTSEMSQKLVTTANAIHNS